MPAQADRSSPNAAVAPLTGDEFASLMAAVGPFETAPRVAVAVSGGADSLALALLLRDWAAARGGEIVALTVDHRLRPDSTAEARQVGAWLAGRRIHHKVLPWRGPHPERGLQAAARRARYGLLGTWCRRNGILHLAVAHHMNDQAETLLLRLARGSGVDGLAAMAPVGESASVRLVRPLLPIGHDRLQATLQAHHQSWIEDPTNRDPAHLRTRMRQLLPALAGVGLTADRLAATAGQLGRARAALDDAVAALLARAVALFPAGYARLDAGAFAAAPREVSLRALARCLLAVGGGLYTPRLERLERLHAALAGGGPLSPRTLAGCRLLHHRGSVLLCREAGQVLEDCAVTAGVGLRWDGRFAVAVAVARSRGPAGPRNQPELRLRRLGAEGWRQIAAIAPDLRRHPIPPVVRPTLPALWCDERVAAVPHLGYRDPDIAEGIGCARLDYAPAYPLASTRFTVA